MALPSVAKKTSSSEETARVIRNGPCYTCSIFSRYSPKGFRKISNRWSNT